MHKGLKALTVREEISMKTETKISNGQFFVLLLLSRVMHLMLYRTESFSSGTPLMVGLLISTAIEIALGVPIFLFLLRKDEIIKACETNKKLCFVIRAIAALYFIFVFGAVLCSFARFMADEFSSLASPVVIIVLLAAASAYCAKLGIEAIARTGTVVLWAFLILLALMALSSEGTYDMLNLVPLQKSDSKAMIDYIIRDISSCRWLVLSGALAGYLKYGSQKAVLGYVAAKFVLIEAVLMMITMILWSFVDIPGYPILALGTYAKTEVIKRFDALNMFVWALNCVVVGATYIHVASDITKKKNVLSFLIPSAVSAIFALLYYKKVLWITNVQESLIMLAGIALLGVLVPLGAVIYWRMKRKCESSCVR